MCHELSGKWPEKKYLRMFGRLFWNILDVHKCKIMQPAIPWKTRASNWNRFWDESAFNPGLLPLFPDEYDETNVMCNIFISIHCGYSPATFWPWRAMDCWWLQNMNGRSILRSDRSMSRPKNKRWRRWLFFLKRSVCLWVKTFDIFGTFGSFKKNR